VDSTIVQGDQVILDNNDSTQAWEKKANDLRPQQQRKIIWILALTAVVTIAIVAGSVCGTGACGSSSDPTLDPVELERRVAVAGFINNITFSGQELVYPFPERSEATPEEQALQWILEDAPLQLTVETPSELFRLRQRYALLSLWFQSKQLWTNTEDWLSSNECNWFGIQCEETNLGDEVGSQFVVLGINFGTGNNIRGHFPPDLCLLTHITYIDVSSNELSGALPDCISVWTGLTHCEINNNELTGALPESIGSWESLS